MLVFFYLSGVSLVGLMWVIVTYFLNNFIPHSEPLIDIHSTYVQVACAVSCVLSWFTFIILMIYLFYRSLKDFIKNA